MSIPTSLTINQPQSIPQPQQTVQEQNQPTPTQPTAQQSNDFVAVDDFLNEFEQVKESTAPVTDHVEPSQAAASMGDGPEPQPTYYATPTAEEPMTDDQAVKETAKFMKFRENLQAYGISYYADGNLSMADQYRYNDQQFKQLVDAYAPLVQSANIKLPPLADILLAEVMCTGPLLGLMQQNRKYRMQAAEAMKKIAKLEQQLVQKSNMRKDVKKVWEIGSNAAEVYGYFTHTPSGTYLKKADRKERPDISDQDVINMLVKHNGKAAVDKLFENH